MKALEIKAYEILKSRFNEQEAEALLDYFETKTSQKIDEKKDFFATKEDIYKLEIKLTEKIAETKSDVIKWMFIFWVGQLAATFAFIKFFMK